MFHFDVKAKTIHYKEGKIQKTYQRKAEQSYSEATLNKVYEKLRALPQGDNEMARTSVSNWNVVSGGKGGHQFKQSFPKEKVIPFKIKQVAVNELRMMMHDFPDEVIQEILSGDD